jgi:arylformamidase
VGVRLVDLSHTVEEGMVTYKGLPAPIVCDFLSFEDSRRHYAEGTEFVISRVELVGNTGTYLDSPFHRHRHGRDLAEVPLASVAHLEAVVVRAVEREGRAIGPERFAGLDVRGKAVLVQTGWDAHWRTDRYFEGHPFLTRASADLLAEAGAALVGIDSYNIDDTGDPTRPVHTVLLGRDIPIVEHMVNLGALPEAGFRFSAVPVKVRGCGSFPVRAFAVVQD